MMYGLHEMLFCEFHFGCVSPLQPLISMEPNLILNSLLKEKDYAKALEKDKIFMANMRQKRQIIVNSSLCLALFYFTVDLQVNETNTNSSRAP